MQVTANPRVNLSTEPFLFIIIIIIFQAEKNTPSIIFIDKLIYMYAYIHADVGVCVRVCTYIYIYAG